MNYWTFLSRMILSSSREMATDLVMTCFCTLSSPCRFIRIIATFFMFIRLLMASFECFISTFGFSSLVGFVFAIFTRIFRTNSWLKVTCVIYQTQEENLCFAIYYGLSYHSVTVSWLDWFTSCFWGNFISVNWKIASSESWYEKFLIKRFTFYFFLTIYKKEEV